MRVVSVTLREFRGYERATASLGEGLTVVWGPNGAGKTNLVEGIYFGCTGYSCRTSNERELVRFGAGTARVELTVDGDRGEHQLAVGYTPGEPKRMSVDGASVQRLLDCSCRPLVAFFAPDRLELIKGVPALRRAHIDQFVSALWPARAGDRRAYNEALAQRNALLARIAAGRAERGSLFAWDRQLAAAGMRLMEDREAAVSLLEAKASVIARSLGLDGILGVAYRPCSAAADAESLTSELNDRHGRDVERRFTTHGPHRDELVFTLEGRSVRAYGSQGQQRLSLLSLLLSERDALAQLRDEAPVLLLDDVMSELDAARREALVELLRGTRGQALITTTDLEHVPGARSPDVTRLAVRRGQVVSEVKAA
jgi:DNA replication and repair protein RecF